MNGTLLTFSEVTISFARVALFQAEEGGDHHFCLCVFFFLFLLKKQQHLQRERKERRRGVTMQWGRGEGNKEAEERFRAAF